MKLFAFSLPLAALQMVAAHSVFTTLFVNDVDQGDGTCVRMNMTPDNCTSPVIDLASNDMACGADGTVGVARVCPVSQGSKLTFLWREWADASHPGSIDTSHKGPCAVYMKAVDSAVTDVGHGAGWFKIWDSGYDSATSQWCTEKLIQNNGLLSVDIPDDILGGYYLVRPELLALHQADKSPPNPQFYIGCAQIFLQSTGTITPKDTVSIPGYVSAGDASVNFNIYTPHWPYPMPGPPPYESGSDSRNNTKAVAVSPQVQREGLMPNGCVLSNANWCGIELDTYSTEAGCWNASTACFEQDTLCYSSAPPTGSKNCVIWEAKCDDIQAACNAGNFNGPPNYGKDLNPTPTTRYLIPPVTPENRGMSSSADSTRIPPKSTALSLVQLLGYTPDPTVSVSFVTDTFLATESQSTSVAFLVTNTVPESTSTVIMTTLTTISSKIRLTVSSTSASTTTSTLPSPINPSTEIPASTDATCGLVSNHTCLGSAFGSCCSQWNWCGITDAYCGQGCQPEYGSCGKSKARREKNVVKVSAHLERHRGH